MIDRAPKGIVAIKRSLSACQNVTVLKPRSTGRVVFQSQHSMAVGGDLSTDLLDVRQDWPALVL